jgi:hypothetical protein
MSALPPKADNGWAHCDVRFVPKADMRLIETELNMRHDGPGFISVILRRLLSK